MDLELYLDISKKVDSQHPSNNAEKGNDNLHIHHKAVFDAFNEALNHQRLYHDISTPLPWDQVSVLKSKISKSTPCYKRYR